MATYDVEFPSVTIIVEADDADEALAAAEDVLADVALDWSTPRVEEY